jgi:hypothetical protein
MLNKRKIILVSLGLIAAACVLRVNFAFADGVLSTNDESKIYTVSETVELLKTNPGSLKNRVIRLEAYVVNAVGGTGCRDYYVLADKNKNVSRQAPTLITGEASSMPGDFYPTYHAVYQGHFYDGWAMKDCGSDGYKRFVIEKKLREIVPDEKPAYETKTIASGQVIANGKYIKGPYIVTLENYKVTINANLYEPVSEEQVNRITELTGETRRRKWQSLVKQLENNKLIIYGGNRYERTMPTYPKTLISDIDIIIRSAKNEQEKREELAKLLDTYPQDLILNDILKNW